MQMRVFQFLFNGMCVKRDYAYFPIVINPVIYVEILIKHEPKNFAYAFSKIYLILLLDVKFKRK